MGRPRCQARRLCAFRVCAPGTTRHHPAQGPDASSIPPPAPAYRLHPVPPPPLSVPRPRRPLPAAGCHLIATPGVADTAHVPNDAVRGRAACCDEGHLDALHAAGRWGWGAWMRGAPACVCWELAGRPRPSTGRMARDAPTATTHHQRLEARRLQQVGILLLPLQLGLRGDGHVPVTIWPQPTLRPLYTAPLTSLSEALLLPPVRPNCMCTGTRHRMRHHDCEIRLWRPMLFAPPVPASGARSSPWTSPCPPQRAPRRPPMRAWPRPPPCLLLCVPLVGWGTGAQAVKPRHSSMHARAGAGPAQGALNVPPAARPLQPLPCK